MSERLIAVADGPDGLFATLDGGGTLSVWSGPGLLRAQFPVAFAAEATAIPARRLALVQGVDGITAVVGSWTGGVAAFGLDGERRWHRPDIRHVQHVRALPSDSSRSVPGVVVERTGGLVLGENGGTRHRFPGASFLAGSSDGALLTYDRGGLSRRPSPDREPAWRIDLKTLAVLDAALDGSTVVCSADGRLTCIDGDGAVAWRTHAEKRRIVRVRPAFDSDGWICLAVPTESRTGSQVLRATADGDLIAIADVAGLWLDLVGHGRYLVASDGRIVDATGPSR